MITVAHGRVDQQRGRTKKKERKRVGRGVEKKTYLKNQFFVFGFFILMQH